MKYTRFEELPCWQDARELSRMVFDLIHLNALSGDYSFKDQIWRAAGSVMDNIAEGFDDGSTNEFVRFLGYAQRSTGEIQSQLYRALDCGYISQEQFNTVYHMASSCRKQIKGFRRYLRSHRSE
ncbi:four helix bundle protein [Desulfosarcina sp.]|uniref:four helix bundle protein n=1 Tax=Desulfosarcina sp. TaxID=2027861 RepID=UPI0035681DA4